MATILPLRPVHLSRSPGHVLRRQARRNLLLAVGALALCTVAAGTQLSRLIAPHWSEIRHAMVNAGGQLLALSGLGIAALRVEKLRDDARDDRRRPDPDFVAPTLATPDGSPRPTERDLLT